MGSSESIWRAWADDSATGADCQRPRARAACRHRTDAVKLAAVLAPLGSDMVRLDSLPALQQQEARPQHFVSNDERFQALHSSFPIDIPMPLRAIVSFIFEIKFNSQKIA